MFNELRDLGEADPGSAAGFGHKNRVPLAGGIRGGFCNVAYASGRQVSATAIFSPWEVIGSAVIRGDHPREALPLHGGMKGNVICLAGIVQFDANGKIRHGNESSLQY